MTAKKKKFELWTLVSLVLLAAFLLFLVYPMFGLLKQAVITPEGKFSLQEFVKFFNIRFSSLQMHVNNPD